MVLTNLAHHLTVDLLTEAFGRLNRQSAPGIDGVTAREYATELRSNLEALIGRVRAQRYRAPSVRRVHIPKGDGSKTRPIGIPTLEDKVLQCGVKMILEAVYEQDFVDCSYGFRPGRSARQAVQVLWQTLMDYKGGWVLEVDIERFFDTLDHAHLRSFLDRRVQDKGLRRLIGKWLKAGVLEQGVVLHPDAGTPQGGVISPLLANVYLHEVLDLWFEQEVRDRLGGSSALIRYADDFVLVFEREEDARRVMKVLPKRLGRYGLRLHPDKTRLVRFVRPAYRGPSGGWSGRRQSFDFLGFTFHWGKSRRGANIVRTKTAKDRFARSVRAVGHWCRANRHRPVAEQRRALSAKLRGHYRYYGQRGNHRDLHRFYRQVQRVWRKWLDRRSWRGRMPWPRFQALLQLHPLAPPRINASPR
jgi:group II intron reverse transcriptase/maturase